jgi:hypothetical protein
MDTVTEKYYLDFPKVEVTKREAIKNGCYVLALSNIPTSLSRNRTKSSAALMPLKGTTSTFLGVSLSGGKFTTSTFFVPFSSGKLEMEVGDGNC